jgi:ribosomal protein S18 acetylase RimI-like enzyme
MTALRCVDWSDVPDTVMTRLYEAEVVRWRRELHWDTASNWVEVERGRRLGTVRGTVVLDADDEAVGWGFALAHDGTIQVGDLVSSSPLVTGHLVDALLDGDHAVDAVSAFTRDVAGVAAALERHGLRLAPQLYLGRDLDPRARLAQDTLEPWESVDMPEVVHLLRRSYADADPCRPFAPGGTEPEWADYLSRLVATGGCGTFDASASGWLRADQGRLAGVILSTRLASDVGHIAQVVVEAACRGRGLGRRLVREACTRLAADGCRMATLFVDSRNTAAVALYESLGFRTVARFISAGRRQPRRLTRPVAGVATITRR